MASVAQLLDIDTKQITADLIKQQLSNNPNGLITDLYVREIAEKVERNLAAATINKPVLSISECLSIEQQLTLSSCYPEYSIDYTGGIRKKNHVVASASRKLQKRLLLDYYGYDYGGKNNVPEGYDDYICDIGGNYADYLVKGWSDVHCCCPPLDGRDAAREVDRQEILRMAVNRGGSYAKQLAGDAAPKVKEFLKAVVIDEARVQDVRCKRTAQRCHRKARYGIMVDSNYDVPLVDLADAMVLKNMVSLRGSFIFHPSILVSGEGRIEGMECNYSINEDGATIEFAFDNDPSWKYRHDLVVYLAYISRSVFTDRKYTTEFLLELMENRMGVQYFQVTRLDKWYYSTLHHNIWFDHLKDMMQVIYYDVDYTALGKRSASPAFVKKTFLVKKKLVDKLRSQAFSQTEQKFKPSEIFNFCMAYCGRMFFGSDVVVRQEQLDFHEAVALSYAVYVEVYKKKNGAGKVLQKLLQDDNYNRELASAGVIQKFLRTFDARKKEPLFDYWDGAKCYFSPVRFVHALLWNKYKAPLSDEELIRRCPTLVEFSDAKACRKLGYRIATAVGNTIDHEKKRKIDHMINSGLKIEKTVGGLNLNLKKYLLSSITTDHDVVVEEEEEEPNKDWVSKYLRGEDYYPRRGDVHQLEGSHAPPDRPDLRRMFRGKRVKILTSAEQINSIDLTDEVGFYLTNVHELPFAMAELDAHYETVDAYIGRNGGKWFLFVTGEGVKVRAFEGVELAVEVTTGMVDVGDVKMVLDKKRERKIDRATYAIASEVEEPGEPLYDHMEWSDCSYPKEIVRDKEKWEDCYRWAMSGLFQEEAEEKKEKKKFDPTAPSMTSSLPPPPPPPPYYHSSSPPPFYSGTPSLVATPTESEFGSVENFAIDDEISGIITTGKVATTLAFPPTMFRVSREGVKVRALPDGDCLFHAITRTNDNTAGELRTAMREKVINGDCAIPGHVREEDLVEELGEKELAGTAVIHTFCAYYGATILSRDDEFLHDEVMYNYKDMPTYMAVLRFEGAHYDWIEHCSKDGNDGARDALFNVNPIDMGRLTNDIAIAEKTELLPFQEEMLSGNSNADYFYSAVLNQCTLHDSCKGGKIIDLLDLLDSKAFEGRLYVLYDDRQLGQIEGDELPYFGERYEYANTPDGFTVMVYGRSKNTGKLKEDKARTVIEEVHKESEDLITVRAEMVVGKNSSVICRPGLITLRLGEGDAGRAISQLRGYVEKEGKLGVVQLVADNRAVAESAIAVLNGLADAVRVVAKWDVKEVDRASVFSPTYELPTSRDGRFRNAMREAREAFRTLTTYASNNLKTIHHKYVRNGAVRTDVVRAEQFSTKNDYGLIDLGAGKWVVKPVVCERKYNYVYDGTNFINIEHCYEDNMLIPGRIKGVYSVSKETVLMNSDEMYRRLRDIDVDNITFEGVDIELTEGVAGCGKTSEIVTRVKMPHEGEKHLVLTSGAEAVKDVRRRLIDSDRISSADDYLKYSCRTTDSYLMHGSPDDYGYDVAWFDEGLMKNFGELLWCAHLSGAKKAYVFGDTAQIPYYNRLSRKHKLLYDLPPTVGDDITRTFRSVTHRCPADVAVLLNRLQCYPKKITTTSKVRRSVTVRYIKNLAEVLSENYKNYQILLFTQADKHTTDNESVVKKYWNGSGDDEEANTGSFTVHQYQGRQTKNVLLLRLNRKTNATYESAHHRLVAFTRHTKNFVYATVDINDDFAKWLKNPVTDAEIGGVTERRNTGGGRMIVRDDDRQKMAYHVVQHPERVFDRLKQETRTRDFVAAHMSSGVVPMRAEMTSVVVPTWDRITADQVTVTEPLKVLQTFYDEVLPGARESYTKYDNDIFETEDAYFSMAKFMLGDMKNYKRPKYDRMTPVLRTACPGLVMNTQKQLLKAFFERNACVPELATLVDECALAKELADVFERTYIVNIELYREYAHKIVELNVDSLENWEFGQPKQTIEAVHNNEFHSIFMRELHRYDYILKKVPKPKLELGAESKYPSPQTIAHHPKQVNAYMCSIMKELKSRLLAVLSPDKIINTDMDVKDLEDLLTHRFPMDDVCRMNKLLEVDISKYDKSQNRLALLFEVEMLTRLGLDPMVVPTWLYTHVYTALYSPFAMFRAEVEYQRKSGDAMTFFGNTLYLMAVLAYSFDLKESFCLFAGDDSMIFSEKELYHTESADIISRTFNLESKLIRKKTPYFCSKFLFIDHYGRWHVIPDVVKLVTKLGRSDLINYAHVEEYRVSVIDNIKGLNDQYIVPQLDDAISDRYQLGEGSYNIVYAALVELVKTEQSFSAGYYINDGDTIDEDSLATHHINDL